MLLHCDLVYAAADAKFNFAFIDLGLLPEAASSYLLPRVLGYSRAAELLLLGEAFTAAKAQECGIVNAVVTAETNWMYSPGRKRSSWRRSHPRRCARPRCCCAVGARCAVEETMQVELEAIAERLASDEVRGIMQAFFARRGKVSAN